jgi:hypothetical protein
MPFRRDKDEPEIVAATLPVPVDFHGGRTSFHDEHQIRGFDPTSYMRSTQKSRRRGSNPHSRREHDFESLIYREIEIMG